MKSIYIFITIIISLVLSIPSSGKENTRNQFTLILDPGHGCKDVGAVDNGAKEKDINLGVALKLKKLVDKKLKDSRVVMTRDDDSYLTLQQRADIANKSKGDLFISIHTNSVDKSNRNRRGIAGSSVYALGLHKNDNNMQVARRENSVIELENDYEQKYCGFDPSKDESYIIFEMAQKKNLSKSIRFAKMAQQQLVKSGRYDRGVHQAGFWVLWATSMPSVLVELDFICNPSSAAYLSSEKGQKELAESIFKAIEDYYAEWDSGLATLHVTDAEERGEIFAESVLGGSQASQRLVVASKKSAKGKEEHGPATPILSNDSSRRRRRSEKDKALSDSRNVETEGIPLHSSMDRIGKEISIEAEPEEPVSDQDARPGKKGKKDKNKKAPKEKKVKEKQKKSERPVNSHNAKVEKFVKVYKIQILASADHLKQNNPRFCGLSPITTYKENGLYKYYYAENENRANVEAILKEVRKKIPDAFIIESRKISSR